MPVQPKKIKSTGQFDDVGRDIVRIGNPLLGNMIAEPLKISKCC